ncbi:MAG: DUF1116 domain-containing protein [Propionibacteriales bacterium]|nr:DUF1116 domain-containing protein [Propionibacteriales bacterium]
MTTGGEIAVVTAGAQLFAAALRDQGVSTTEVTWTPPIAGSEASLATVMLDRRRAPANEQALTRMLAAQAALVAVRPAQEALSLERGHFLHAGPPIGWERASGPLRGALIGAALLEGLANSPEEAERAFAAGSFSLEPAHHRGAVGPMAGVVSSSMWVFELDDATHGSTSWCSLNEGLGKVLRYGAYGPEVIERLRWMGDVLGPALDSATRTTGAIDILAIIAQMIQMGDEGHNRNRAGTLMVLKEWLPALITSGLSTSDIADVVTFVSGNDHFFLNLVMPACKLMTTAATGVPGSSVVTTMARNGTDFGVQVSGCGEQWFTGPAQVADGLYLGNYGPADANPDIGDSAITETAGIGGFAMATAPAIVRFVGGTVPDALATTRRMYDLCVGENPSWALPIMDFRGTPTGIDVTTVLRTGQLPQINTGMAGKVAGVGQVGAGLVSPPMQCFESAITALADAVPR